MELHELAYVALFTPLVVAALIGIFTLRFKALSGWLAVAGIGVVLGATGMMVPEVLGSETAFSKVHEFTWLSMQNEAGDVILDMRFGVTVDALSVLMSLIVGIVGFCVFLFSVGYMHGEEGYSRYFSCISLFAFSMQGIVFSTSLVQTFVFWELVGVSSYLLIGYYFAKPSAVDAGKKAFLTNRIGDFGMTVGILLLFYTLVQMVGLDRASFSFHEIRALYESGAVVEGYEGTLAIAALLIFTGAVAKSAQVPLHVWLPDAMEGPTPVSALMHAATMVAAGVYLVARVFFLFAPFEDALAVVAWMGGITALLAAGLAFVQNDIKKVLAYSTLSQLGYMVLAMGCMAPAAGMFHLTTHAFFKGLLFLAAGSVIHGCHHEQDMRRMGGLIKTMPVTAWTFLIGSLALAGIPPFAGFWSKDAVLAAASEHNAILYGMGVLVAAMTACYTGRACFMTFFGEYRGDHTPHESPKVMTIPLVILAALAVVSGYALHHGHIAEQWLISEGAPSWFEGVKLTETFHWDVAVGGTVAALIGAFIAAQYYLWRKWNVEGFVEKAKPLHRLLLNKYYFDDFYLWLVQGVQQRIADGCGMVERNILVNGIVNGVAEFHKWCGRQIRLLLDGHIHRYVTMALVGVVFVLSMIWARGF